MKISVVIPLYNKRPYIRRAVESVLRQTTPAAEIIVVDDGSTDDGAKVVKGLSDPRLKLIQHTNQGECAARNRGVAEAFYPLIGFLDADDEWKPDFLERIQVLMNRFPGCGAYATSAQIVKPDQSIAYPLLVNIPAEPWIGLIPNFFELFQAGYAFNASSIVVPKAILGEVDGFPNGVKISGDVACWVKIALRRPIAFDPTRAVVYHQEAQNRVGNHFIPLKEMPYIPLICAAIRDGVLPKELQPDALEFMAQKQIFVAVQNVMAGNPAYARQLLASCQYTKKYRRNRLWWMFWAHLPAKWPSAILYIKQLVFGELNVHFSRNSSSQ
jgi:glycosyltransferase involved in cell wall biosynthesis